MYFSILEALNDIRTLTSHYSQMKAGRKSKKVHIYAPEKSAYVSISHTCHVCRFNLLSSTMFCKHLFVSISLSETSYIDLQDATRCTNPPQLQNSNPEQSVCSVPLLPCSDARKAQQTRDVEWKSLKHLGGF